MTNRVEDDALWNHRGGGGEGGEISSSSGEMQQILMFDFGSENIHINSSFRNPEETSMCNYFKSPEETSRSSYEGTGSSKRLKVAQQGGSVESSDEETSLLGLTLKKTPSFINLLEAKLSEGRQRKCSPSPSAKQQKMKEPMTGKDENLDNEKLKASHFPALHLRIGNWERNSRHEGNLVAKCYYKKGRLVWEILEGALKSKIETQFSDIIGIRASKADDESGILEIELNEKPLFFKETNPQPRKHTLWQQADDFTGGEALICRRHCVKFAPGILEKHYERLLQYDQRLYMLSQMPFPSQHSPYFPKPSGHPEFSLDFSVYRSHIHPMAQHPYYQSFPASMAPARFQNLRQTTRTQLAFVESNPTMSVSNVMLENQNIAILNEATNIASGNYVQMAGPISSAVPNNLDFPNYPNMTFPNQDLNAITQGQGRGILNANTSLLDVENHFLGDMQAMNEKTVLARASPMCSSLLPTEVAGGRTINERATQSVGENSTSNNGLPWSDSNWLSQYRGVAIQPSTNHSFYPHGLPNQTNGNF